MNPQDSVQEREKKIQSLEQELAELRQDLAAAEDFFLQVKALADAHEVRAELDNEILKTLTEEDAEFEGIWNFHQQILMADPDGSIPLDTMYKHLPVSAAITGESRWTRRLSSTCSRRWKIPARKYSGVNGRDAGSGKRLPHMAGIGTTGFMSILIKDAGLTVDEFVAMP